MNEEIKKSVLKLLSSKDKNWTWYSLDRALSSTGMGGRENIARLASELAGQGLVEIVEGETESMPVYILTAKGRALVSHL
ncbi:hypothetical protein GCM10007901_37670 [Dyella acidisoli]|uniref:MarR family transcriptional regulator n=1 Tax=Dyella acidisoli TaxID=1867834 RepID=A0ABQ5XSV6_9GAMM|nr:hypothetical protein GCM10007901_37670 [Dyella acidisoli]